MYYRAEVSYDEYRELLSSSREGIHISAEELCQVDRLISPLLKKGQPVAHIYATYGNDIPFSQRTLYGHIDKGLLSVNNLDLPRKVRYKERGKPRRVAPDKAYKKGRAYKDFQEFLFLNPEVNVIEMDTVHGMVSGKALLTMLFRNCSFMLAFLIDEISQDAVTEVFKTLKESLTPPVFSKTFPVFLTDNGPEFFHWPTFLSCPDGEILSEIFYCDPNAAYQKGKLEKNHEFIRYVVPKGKPFDSLSQQKVNIMINHINSTKRASLNDSTPFGLAQKLLPEKLFEALDLKLIDPDQVVLKPILVKS
jgi:IS30 family transposase